MLDNLDIAILTKVNELAERHGLKPTDFVATTSFNPDNLEDPRALNYESHPNGAEASRRFYRMLDQLGLKQGSDQLKGTDEEIIDALNQALHVAPKRRPRS